MEVQGHPLGEAHHLDLRVLLQGELAAAVEAAVAAADHDQLVLRRGELPGDLLRRRAHGACPHAAAGQDDDMALILQVEGAASRLLIQGADEVRGDGDARGVEPGGVQPGGGKLLQQRRVGDAVAVHIQLTHAGGAGVVRGHEPGGKGQLPPAAQLGYHHGREHMDTDGSIGPIGPEGLPEEIGPLDGLLIQQRGGVSLLHAVAYAVELGGIAVGKVVALADKVGRGLRQEGQGIPDNRGVAQGRQLPTDGSGGAVVPAAGGAGEDRHFHFSFLAFRIRRSSRGRLYRWMI